MANEIKIMDGGPIVISGSVKYTDVDGNEQTSPGKAFALCRCGQSANKPFCDGAHSGASFEATEIVLTLND